MKIPLQLEDEVVSNLIALMNQRPTGEGWWPVVQDVKRQLQDAAAKQVVEEAKAEDPEPDLVTVPA